MIVIVLLERLFIEYVDVMEYHYAMNCSNRSLPYITGSPEYQMSKVLLL